MKIYEIIDETIVADPLVVYMLHVIPFTDEEFNTIVTHTREKLKGMLGRDATLNEIAVSLFNEKGFFPPERCTVVYSNEIEEELTGE